MHPSHLYLFVAEMADFNTIMVIYYASLHQQSWFVPQHLHHKKITHGPFIKDVYL